MKVLFLDIDGVLNSGDNMYAMTILWKKNKGDKSMDQFGHRFDERCVRWLTWIVSQTGCKIVISSTWKHGGFEKMLNLWNYRKLPGQLIGITPTAINNDIFEKYSKINEGADRGYEIQQWIEDNRPEKYCIVDDDSDMLSHQNFVRTNHRIGLNYETAHEIVKILNS